MIASFILLTLTLIYSGFIFWCLKGWKKNSVPNQRLNTNAHTIDIVIAIRNEARSIYHLLEQLSLQTYIKSNFRVVVVDDHSSDNSAGIVADFFKTHPAVSGLLLHAEGNGKKSAMAQAIRLSNAELILTTDGDCNVGENWLRSMVEPFSDPKISFVAGPVILTGGKSLISLLQRMEMIGLTGIAGASIQNHRAMMCNGANLCFRKSSYEKVQGYSGSAFASGDDTQLMRKFNSEDPGQLTFVRSVSALVKSHSERSLGSFWQQRRRWATKIPFTLSFFTVFIAIVSWLVHSGLLVGLILSFFYQEVVLLFLLSFAIKFCAEIMFLKKVGNDLDQKTNSVVIFLIQPFYWVYITLVGIAVPFATYEWKGRKLK